MKPTTSDYVDWVALRLVREGWVVRYRGAYLDSGAGFLVPALEVLRAAGLVVPAPDRYGLERLSLTDTGRPRYRQLCHSKQDW